MTVIYFKATRMEVLKGKRWWANSKMSVAVCNFWKMTCRCSQDLLKIQIILNWKISTKINNKSEFLQPRQTAMALTNTKRRWWWRTRTSSGTLTTRLAEWTSPPTESSLLGLKHLRIRWISNSCCSSKAIRKMCSWRLTARKNQTAKIFRKRGTQTWAEFTTTTTGLTACKRYSRTQLIRAPIACSFRTSLTVLTSILSPTPTQICRVL